MKTKTISVGSSVIAHEQHYPGLVAWRGTVVRETSLRVHVRIDGTTTEVVFTKATRKQVGGSFPKVIRLAQ